MTSNFFGGVLVSYSKVQGVQNMLSIAFLSKTAWNTGVKFPSNTPIQDIIFKLTALGPTMRAVGISDIQHPTSYLGGSDEIGYIFQTVGETLSITTTPDKPIYLEKFSVYDDGQNDGDVGTLTFLARTV